MVFLPPWAEEANKSKRMMARLGQALAQQGYLTLVPDFFGTGDSEGDFREAEWHLWKDNVLDAVTWLRQQGCGPISLGGLRLGALMAAEMSREVPEPPEGILLWNPVTSGAQVLKQFLRLRLASGLGLGRYQPEESMDDLQGLLSRGESVEVAGYEISPGMAQALQERELQGFPPPRAAPVQWMDLVAGPESAAPPASRGVVAAWEEGGRKVSHRTVTGTPFWSTQELVDVPGLIDLSVATMRRRRDAELSDHAC